MWEKIAYGAAIVVICVYIMFFIGCGSTGELPVESTIAGNQRSVGRIENAVDFLERTIEDSRGRITSAIESSESIADGIERLEYLFGQYELEVEQLRKEIERLRVLLKEETNGNSNLDNNIDSSSISQGINSVS